MSLRQQDTRATTDVPQGLYHSSDIISLNNSIAATDNKGPIIAADYQRCLKWNGIGNDNSVSGACYSGEIFCFLSDSDCADNRNDGKSSILREIIGVCKDKAPNAMLHNIYINYVSAPHVQQLNRGYENGSLLDVQTDAFCFDCLTVQETLSFYNAMKPDANSAENISHMNQLLCIMQLDSVRDTRVTLLRAEQKRLLIIAVELLIGRDCIIYEQFNRGLTAVETVHLLSVLKQVLIQYNPNCFFILSATNVSLDELYYVDRIQVLSEECETSYYGVTAPVKAYFTGSIDPPTTGYCGGDGNISNATVVVDGLSQSSKNMRQPFTVLSPQFFRHECWLSFHATCAIESAPAPIHTSADMDVSSLSETSVEGIYDTPSKKQQQEEASATSSSGGVVNVQQTVVGYTEMDSAVRTPMYEHLLPPGGGASSSVMNKRFSNPVSKTAIYNTGTATNTRTFSRGYAGSIASKSRLTSAYNKAYDTSFMSYLTRLGRQCGWCFWRSFTVHWRLIDTAVFVWMIGGVTASIGVLVTFYDLKYTEQGFQNRCALITTYPFGVLTLCNIMFSHTLKSRNVLAWDRNRETYLPVFGLFSDFVADLCVFKLIPPFLACCIPYYGLNFNRTWGAFWVFTECMMYLTVVAGTFARAMFTCLAPSIHMEPAKAAVSTVGVYAIMILYAGFIVNIPTLPDWVWFLRDWSMFYWGCNVMYYNDMGNT